MLIRFPTYTIAESVKHLQDIRQFAGDRDLLAHTLARAWRVSKVSSHFTRRKATLKHYGLVNFIRKDFGAASGGYSFTLTALGLALLRRNKYGDFKKAMENVPAFRPLNAFFGFRRNMSQNFEELAASCGCGHISPRQFAQIMSIYNANCLYMDFLKTREEARLADPELDALIG